MKRLLSRGVVLVGFGVVGSVVWSVMSPAGASRPTTHQTGQAAARSLHTFVVGGSHKNAIAPTSAELQDLQQLATSTGASLPDIEASYTGQSQFNDVATQIETSYPDLFTNQGHADSGVGYKYWITFTQKPPASVVDTLASLPVAVQVRYGAPLSSIQSMTVSSTILASLQNRLGVTAAHAGLSPDGTHINVVYQTGAQRSDIAATRAEGRIAADARDASVGQPFPIHFERHSSVHPNVAQVTTVQGGRQMWSQHTAFDYCTGGFTAIRDGNEGIITAKHCANDLYYANYGDIAFGAAANDIVKKGEVDLQFSHVVDPTVTNKQFRATGRTASDDRTVTSVSDAGIGDAICKWGDKSGYDCTTVSNTGQCYDITWSSGSVHHTCGLTVTAGGITQGGDSGGPWFYGNQANGITCGLSSSNHSLLTAITNASIYLSASVRQN